MPRRRPKIPRTTAHTVPFQLDASDWERIERAYGTPLSQQVRDEIVDQTEDFLYWASAEQTQTPSLQSAQGRVESLRDLTESLLKEIQRNTDVSPYTDELIADIFGGLWRKDTGRIALADRDSLPLVVTKPLSSFLLACNDALDHMKSLSSKTWIWGDGEAWKRWVLGLSDLAKTNSLPRPSSVSKPKLSPEKASPFVRFIEQLQLSVPVKYRQSCQSSVALAEAIKRARRSRNAIEIDRDR
jgi:hypothetical protein